MSKDNPNQSSDMLKLAFEHSKHLATLSTGSIVLITIFLEKIFQNPVWKFLVGISFGGFILCLIGGIAFQIYLLTVEDWYDESMDKVGFPIVFSMWIGFIVGIISLAIFGLKNF